MNNETKMPDVIHAGKDDEAEITFWYQTEAECLQTEHYTRTASLHDDLRQVRDAIEALNKSTRGRMAYNTALARDKAIATLNRIIGDKP